MPLATIKHIASKNANYGNAELYLTFQHDEFSMKPVLDDAGHYVPRESFLYESLLCGEDDFAIACMKSNLEYRKNDHKGDIKSHHYIISFDPRDGPDNGLTLERAQALGIEFCKTHFPGHQAIVCTHPDGHNQNGNIHCHIVINSLRIEDVPFLPYMDRPCDTKAGMKHRCTAAALRYLRAEVMEMCERENLYQIDLLNGRKDRITEREYWAKRHGQEELDKEISGDNNPAGIEIRQTKFETEKEKLRTAIRAAMGKASTFDDFIRLLSEKGITVKESRGRFSYLTPDRTKPITARKLGDDFSKEAVLANLAENTASIIDPVEKTAVIMKKGAAKQSDRTQVSLQKVVDIEAKKAAGYGAGYERWAKNFNLKQMASALYLYRQHGFESPEELDQAIESAHAALTENTDKLKAIEETLKEKKELRKHLQNYRASKETAARYKAIRDPAEQEAFYEAHRAELMLRETAQRYFKEHGARHLPKISDLNDEIAALVSEKNEYYTFRREAAAREKELTTIRANIEASLGKNDLVTERSISDTLSR